jgi:hypothetical protein
MIAKEVHSNLDNYIVQIELCISSSRFFPASMFPAAIIADSSETRVGRVTRLTIRRVVIIIMDALYSERMLPRTPLTRALIRG